MTYTHGNYIMTVTGLIKASELGFCHSHEHLFLADGQSARVHSALRLDDFNKTINELELFKAIGGKSIIDAQPVGCGRMAANLVQASMATGIQIVASTGFHKLIFYPHNHWIHTISTDDFTSMLMNELNHGMFNDGDTGFPKEQIKARAGLIKAASDKNGVDDQYKRLFTAAALASKATGSPIMCHTEMGRGALGQVNIFLDYGVPVESIIICHLDRVLEDVSYQLEIAKTGVYLELDTIGRFKYHSDEEEAEFIVKLVEHGYEDQILLGLDTTRERMKSYGGSLGLDYIFNNFIPLLKRYGLSDDLIKKFMVHNPAKAFINKQLTKQL